MHLALQFIGWTGFGVAVVLGLALNLVGLFGNWVILGAVGVLWAVTGFQHFGPWPLVVMLGLAILGEVIETGAASYGAVRGGGRRGAAVAALIGCLAGSVLGTPWFPIIGTVLGGCAGAFAGALAHEMLLERRQVRPALRTGLGAALGKIGGIFAKFAIGLLILALAALTY